MKISEALLYIVKENGGRIEHTQVARWIGQLVKAGYLEIYHDRSGEELEVGYQLTDKAKEKIET
ncbi:hypothetical protein HWB91_gp60 [Bacillus phage vB_BboS-125]|uniref:Uncharacterized protein n=1 Tax=Bacillus phage vB_BboS-125 TaxID=2419618 RepID=A0A3G3BW97_9CAUD|nr:hypothetical protein HWB91_gp60 [Bacillus phage vB_BboS-125]AYP68430.1 hypothetical protein BboS125_00061 [Bacillus phage vB_BboS-125]